MATRKPAPAQRVKPKLTKNQQELKTLKAAGLFKGDWRKAKVASGAQKRLRKQYKDDIKLLAEGKAKAVKVPKGTKTAAGQKPHNGRVIVRVEQVGQKETIRYNKKTKEFTSIVYREGVKYRRRILTRTVEDMGDVPRGPKLRYLVPFKQWELDSPLFEDPEVLARFMAEYEPPKGTFKDWLSYLVILELLEDPETAEENLYD